MKFKPGQSGNPSGRPKGALSKRVALKNLLEELFIENNDLAREKLQELLDDPRQFRWLCQLKADYELKELPNKHEGEGLGDKIFNVVVKVDNGDKSTSEPVQGVSRFVKV